MVRFMDRPENTSETYSERLRNIGQDHFKSYKKVCLLMAYKVLMGGSRILHSNTSILPIL